VPEDSGVGSSPLGRGRVGRDAAVVTLSTMASRSTGFVRVLVAAAVLGNGVLGDTYHAANLVPNLLFELVAAGSLQAVLVPAFVAAHREGGDEALGRAAAAVSGVAVVVLGAIAVVGVAASSLLATLLTAGSRGDTAADQRDLVAAMLIVFLPQIVFYGLGMVATAALAAKRRFVAAALAPAVNNVIVIVCYLAYRASRRDEVASLDLTRWQFAMLAGGTTLAVVVFTAVPGIVLRASGVRWRPRLDLAHPAVRGLRRSFGWATLSVFGTLLPTGAAVLLGVGATGGIAVFAMTFAFFVLPHSLVAVPLATAIAPRVADAWQRGQHAEAAELTDRAMRVLVPLLALATAGLVGLAWPIARVAASFGQAASQGYTPIAQTLAAFGVGLIGYGVSFLMLRVLFSVGEVRSAALLVTIGSVVGVAVMSVLAATTPAEDRSVAMALGYGASQVMAAILLSVATRRALRAPTLGAVVGIGAVSIVAGAAAATTMWMVQHRFEADRAGAMAAIAVAGAAGVLVFVVVLALAARRFGGGSPIAALRSLRPGRMST
jgi:putative peptidoglycan lipid II flippase